MTEAVIDIDALTFRWQRQRECCLDVPALRIVRGEHTFLHGPSGSGKSTLLSLIGGIVLPHSGRVSLLGCALGALSASQRDRLRADCLGIVFQQFNLVPYLSMLDNVMLACRFSEVRKRRAQAMGRSVQAEAQRLLKQLGLGAADWSAPAMTLSVGQQQRVAVARALIGQPALVIADEPTSALDEWQQQAFIDLLLGEADALGTTVLMASHAHSLAGRFRNIVALPAINRADKSGASCAI